jgi:hypothetical protein
VTKKLIALALISVSSAFAFGIAGCKQGSGERCQVDADCADGLKCSQSEPKTCGGDNMVQEDAIPPPQPVDAAIDAAIDGP